MRALSHSSLKLQLQFGVIPLLSYVFDYFTRIYTDLLSSGNQAAVEFMPFVCSLAYLVFVLQTTQEQKLRSQLEQTQNSLNLQVAQAVREIDACGKASARPAPTATTCAIIYSTFPPASKMAVPKPRRNTSTACAQRSKPAR